MKGSRIGLALAVIGAGIGIYGIVAGQQAKPTVWPTVAPLKFDVSKIKGPDKAADAEPADVIHYEYETAVGEGDGWASVQANRFGLAGYRVVGFSAVVEDGKTRIYMLGEKGCRPGGERERMVQERMGERATELRQKK